MQDGYNVFAYTNLPSIWAISKNKNFTNFDSFATCSQCIFHAFSTDVKVGLKIN